MAQRRRLCRTVRSGLRPTDAGVAAVGSARRRAVAAERAMTTVEHPRVAMLGCGRWGRNIARVLGRLGALKVIADPAVEALTELATTLRVELTERADTVLAAADIDAVAIAVPAAQHADLVRAALAAGKHG